MLFRQRFLDALARGEVDLAFRRWNSASARAGGTQRTAVGVVEFVSVRVVLPEQVSEAEARRAGHASRAELLADTDRQGDLHRIELRLAGADPRVALRARTALSEDELAEVRRRLDRYDSASKRGAWTRTVLRLIAECPGVPAAQLAARCGRETQPFKVDVRKLKELGLTESLDVGYRISPRGDAVLAALS